MVNIILFIILLVGIYSGARRGLILQAVLMAGYILTWVVANLFHQKIASILKNIIPFPSDTTASQLSLYNLSTALKIDEAFYTILSFIIILFIGWIVTRLVGLTLNRLSRIPIITQLNFIGGALLGFICNWLGLYFILTLLSFVPFGAVQDIFTGNSLATFIVKNTPVLSQVIMNMLLNR